LGERQYGIFFLRRRLNGDYEVVDPVHPCLVASPAYARNVPGAAEPLDRVVAELVRVLATPSAQLVDPVNGTGTIMPDIVDDSDRLDEAGLSIQSHWVPTPPAWKAQFIYGEAANTLELLSPDRVLGPVRQLATSGEPVAQIMIVQLMLRFGDVSYLSKAASLLARDDPDLYPAVSGLCDTIYWMMPPADEIPALKELMALPVVDARRAAAHVLSIMDTPEIVEPLAAALDDPDSTVRYHAVRGLGHATGAAIEPDVAEFRANEADYVRRWKEWAHDHVQ
jgi:hypothetical protein